MKVGVRHPQFLVDPVEAQIQVRLREAQRMSDSNLPTVSVPLVHGPEVAFPHVYLEVIHDLRDKGELLRRADGTADSRLLLVDCFQVQTYSRASALKKASRLS